MTMTAIVTTTTIESWLLEVPADQQAIAIELDEEFVSLGRKTVEQIYRMGEIASCMKAILPHGGYSAWVESRGINLKTLNAWVHISQSFGNTSELQNFVPSALGLLAQPSLPEFVREEATSLAASGQVVDLATARDLKERAKEVLEAGNEVMWRNTPATVVRTAGDRRVVVNLPDGAFETVNIDEIRPLDQYVPPSKEIKHPGGVLASRKSSERYTPILIWQAGLDAFEIQEFCLDPATYDESPIPTKVRYTKRENGLEQHWRARYLWSNFPYSGKDDDGKDQNCMNEWVAKLCDHYEEGDIENAITLVKSDCRPAWFQRLLRTATGVCFIAGALRFESPSGQLEGSYFGSNAFYLGDRLGYTKFAESYGRYGYCTMLNN